MRSLTAVFIDVPEKLASWLAPLGPLAARIVIGWVFLWSGWGSYNLEDYHGN